MFLISLFPYVLGIGFFNRHTNQETYLNDDDDQAFFVNFHSTSAYVAGFVFGCEAEKGL